MAKNYNVLYVKINEEASCIGYADAHNLTQRMGGAWPVNKDKASWIEYVVATWHGRVIDVRKNCGSWIDDDGKAHFALSNDIFDEDLLKAKTKIFAAGAKNKIVGREKETIKISSGSGDCAVVRYGEI